MHVEILALFQVSGNNAAVGGINLQKPDGMLLRYSPQRSRRTFPPRFPRSQRRDLMTR